MKAIILYELHGEPVVDIRDFSEMAYPPSVGGIANRFHERMQLKKGATFHINGENITPYKANHSHEDYQLIKIDMVYYNEYGTETGRIPHDDFKDMVTPCVVRKKRAPKTQTIEMDLDDERS